MPISESKNKANRAWDRDNMHTVSCRVRTEDAIEFSEYCKENNTKPGAILKDFVYGKIRLHRELKCINEKEDLIRALATEVILSLPEEKIIDFIVKSEDKNAIAELKINNLI